jgi:Cu2+-exporting ATPase
VKGKNIKVVSPGYLKEKQIGIPTNSISSEAETIVFVLIEEQLIGFIALADEVRPESRSAIEAFKKNGIKVMMATGDNEKVAKAVADELGP